MTKTEELKERIKKLPVKYPKGTSKITLEKDWIFELGQKVILKEWLEREEEIMKMIDNRIDDEEGNYNLTKTSDDLNHLNIYFRSLKKLKELKEEINK